MRKNTIRLAAMILIAALAVASPLADARTSWTKFQHLFSGGGSTVVHHDGEIEFAFSPHEGAEDLVLKVIGSARSEIRMMSYSLTSARVVDDLIKARKRGVDVAIVADYKNNVSEDRSGKARAALSALVNAGCRVRVISAYPIHHDKVIIADRETVETGSFNYSSSAAGRNSENVLVVWRNQDLARGYLKHWESRFSQGEEYRVRY